MLFFKSEPVNACVSHHHILGKCLFCCRYARYKCNSETQALTGSDLKKSNAFLEREGHWREPDPAGFRYATGFIEPNQRFTLARRNELMAAGLMQTAQSLSQERRKTVKTNSTHGITLTYYHFSPILHFSDICGRY